MNYNMVEFDSREGNSLTTLERKSVALTNVLPTLLVFSFAIVKKLFFLPSEIIFVFDNSISIHNYTNLIIGTYYLSWRYHLSTNNHHDSMGIFKGFCTNVQSLFFILGF
jgi:hypothetical protein